MNNNQYTSIELSKLLNEKMEYESEMWHQYTQGRGNDSIVAEKYSRWGIQHADHFEYYPALTFTDLLHWLKLYGEKIGWDEVCSECGEYFVVKKGSDIGLNTYKDTDFYCCSCGNDVDPFTIEKITFVEHKLLDAYLADNLTIGTNVESFLLDVIK